MTLLSIVQDACNEVGQTEPTSVIDSTDPIIKQMLALSNRGGKSLAQRFPWQEGIKEFTLTTVAAEDQGAVETVMPGFNWQLYRTTWNRTLQQPIGGPLYPSEWQMLKAANMSGPWPDFRIRGKRLLLLPIPTAGQTIAGEYASRYWCESSGGSDQDKWADDTDVGLLPEELLTLDLVWRWFRAKRLDYAEEKMEFEIQVNNFMSRSGSNRVLNLDSSGDRDNIPPHGLLIPPGNWNQ